MLLTIGVLALAGVYIEMRAVRAWPALGRFLENHRDVALGFSLLLSVLLGLLFGAAGVLIFAAGVTSSVLIQPWYAARKNGQLDRLRHRQERLQADVVKWYDEHQDRMLRRARQTWHVCELLYLVIRTPFRVLGWMMDAIERLPGMSKR